MADSKITALTSIGASTDPANDPLVLVDVSDTSMAASGTTKKVTLNQLLGASGTATLASATITGDLTVRTTGLTVNSSGVGVGTSSQSSFLGNSPKKLVIGDGTQTPALTLYGGTANVSGIYYAKGTVGNEAYRGFIEYNHAVDALTVGISGSTAMTLNSTGLGVGVTPSAWRSTQKALQIGAVGAYFSSAASGGSTCIGRNVYESTAGNFTYIVNDEATLYEQSATGQHAWYTAAASTGTITFTQAMTLDASGNLLVGTTSQIRGGKLSVDSSAGVASGLKSSAGSSVFVEELWNTGSLDNSFINFGTDSTFTARGSITYNRSGGLVAYNTTSDYRAKDIIGPVSNSGSVIDSLKVYIGKMKGASVERPMLVAHEAQIVAPYSVTGQKDEVDADGNPKYQQMDVSSFVPLLIAEIQSLRTRVAALEA